VRPSARYTDQSDYARLCARVQELTAAGWSLEAIARQLEVDGYPPLRSKQLWSSVRVQTLRRQLGLGNTHRQGQSREPLGPDEWWGRELAERLGGARTSLLYWIERSLVRARKESGGIHRWIVWAAATELERLRAHRDRDIAAEQRRRWAAAYTGTDHQKGSTP
jgi:recombinase